MGEARNKIPMSSHRKVNRITPKEFEDYRVLLELDELTLEGQLGNVSETGLCIIMDDNSLLDEIGNEIPGIIISKDKKEKISFLGKVVWYKVQKTNNEITHLSGIEFHKPVDLTNQLAIKSIYSDT